jgi:hypothetical protein
VQYANDVDPTDETLERVRVALTRVFERLGHPYCADEDDVDALVLALSQRGVVVLAKEDYDALVIRARDRRDTDVDDLRPTLAPMGPAHVCAHCGKPAACFGRYDNMTTADFACDECCGHGCEDGRCIRIELDDDV